MVSNMMTLKNKMKGKRENDCIIMYYNYKSELLLLRGLKPSDYDRLGLFLGCCLIHCVRHQRHYIVRVCLKNLYRMLDLNRHPLLHTTSRRAAPLGDPRGIPKLSRKFSLRKYYLRLGQRVITSVHNFKFQGPVNIFVASTSATRKFFQVNIDLVKMSAFEEMDFPFSSFFDGLLQELGDTMEFVSDETPMPILNDEELDFTSDFNIDMLDVVTEVSEVITPPSVLPPPPEAEAQATVVINIPSELDLVWNPLELSPPQPVAGLSHDQIEKEKNNQASRAYRQRKKAKLAAKEEELEVLENKNRELSVKASAMEDIVKELKSKVVSLLANERVGGVKRNHEADTIFGKKIKM